VLLGTVDVHSWSQQVHSMPVAGDVDVVHVGLSCHCVAAVVVAVAAVHEHGIEPDTVHTVRTVNVMVDEHVEAASHSNQQELVHLQQSVVHFHDEAEGIGTCTLALALALALEPAAAGVSASLVHDDCTGAAHHLQLHVGMLPCTIAVVGCAVHSSFVIHAAAVAAAAALNSVHSISMMRHLCHLCRQMQH
jgi:hypothetical protein